MLQLSKLVDGLGLNVHNVSENDTKKILSHVQCESHVEKDVSCSPPPAPPLPCQQTPSKPAVTRISCYWLMKTLNK